MDNFFSAIICFGVSAVMTTVFIDTGSSVAAGLIVYLFGFGIVFAANK